MKIDDLFLTKISSEHDGKKGDHESYPDSEFEFHIDEVLNKMDGNRDGYIDYIEFITTEA